jgi:hypothetical protein
MITSGKMTLSHDTLFHANSMRKKPTAKKTKYRTA